MNNTLITNDKKFIKIEDFKENGYVQVSHGKKKHFIIKLG
jgi:hypothetical protein